MRIAALVLIALPFLAALIWVLTNDQRRENEKRKAARRVIDDKKP